MFITLEGGEGAGKSTQARMLAEALEAQGRRVIVTREPGGAPGAEVLRRMLLSGEHGFSAVAEVYLHFAARAEHLERTVLPGLADGAVVLSDRFADSTMAYQGYGLGADRCLIAGLTRLLPVMPDLTLMLRVDAARGAARVQARGARTDRYEALDASFHARVAEGFGAIAAAEPERCRVVDANADIASVHAEIMGLVRGAFGP